MILAGRSEACHRQCGKVHGVCDGAQRNGTGRSAEAWTRRRFAREGYVEKRLRSQHDVCRGLRSNSATHTANVRAAKGMGGSYTAALLNCGESPGGKDKYL